MESGRWETKQRPVSMTHGIPRGFEIAADCSMQPVLSNIMSKSTETNIQIWMTFRSHRLLTLAVTLPFGWITPNPNLCMLCSSESCTISVLAR